MIEVLSISVESLLLIWEQWLDGLGATFRVIVRFRVRFNNSVDNENVQHHTLQNFCAVEAGITIPSQSKEHNLQESSFPKTI